LIHAIKDLGEQKLKRENRDVSNLLSILVQNPNQDGRYPYLLIIVFKKIENNYTYSHIAVEMCSKSKIEKYLYRRGASNGPDFTPTAKITDISKTFKIKIIGWFKGMLTTESMQIGLKNAIEQSGKKILQDLSDKWNEIKPQLDLMQSGIITLGIEEDNNLNYLGDYQIFRDLLVRSVKVDYHKIVKSNHICSICGEKKTEVFGEAIPFHFYTLDKPGYIAGGFNEKDAWKNAPICLECSLKIDEGKKFLNENLKRKMGGQQYYLIPKFILGVEGIEDVVNTFFNYSTHPNDILSGKTLKRITEDENDIFQNLGKLNDVLTYNFLFFSAPNPAVFKINLLVEEVLPSRISEIFRVKSEVEENDIFKNIKIKKNKYENIEFRFDEFRRFAPSQKGFLEVVDKTFHGVNLEPGLLFSWLMTPIRQSFLNEFYLKPIVLKGLVSLVFFKNLGILSQKESFYRGGEVMTELTEKAEVFFKGVANTFPTPVHKGVFLLGVLGQKLLNIQYQDRGAKPFRKNLKGLKMKEEDFKALLAKIQNKLEDYGKNYYRSLETLISGYFLQAGKDWRINTDELNFYFILGMNLVEEVDKALNLTKQKED
jgi:CRISPR-associated protein Csh1